jgi:sirohydrochlorin cobaltochelatase
MEQDQFFRRDEPLSMDVPAGTTALLLAAHGERRPGATNEAVVRLVARLRARNLAAQIGCGFIKGTPTIREAIEAFTADTIIVYPLFLSDGYFARVRLPELLDEAIATTHPRALRILPPLGLDPGFPVFITEQAAAAARARRLGPSRINLVLLAHGSSTDPASCIATGRLAEAIGKRRRFRSVQMALLGESPSLAQTAARLAGPMMVLGLFAGDGMHGATDAARLVTELDRPDALFAGTIANFDGIEQLVASAVQGPACRKRVTSCKESRTLACDL